MLPLPLLPFCLPSGEYAKPMRLDAALALMVPKLGLRARRRLWQSYTITVNGVSRKPGHIVFPGDTILIAPASTMHKQPAPLADGLAACAQENAEGRQSASAPQCLGTPDAEPAVTDDGRPYNEPENGPALLYADAHFLAFFKPSGLHSAHIAGSPLPSLETLLPSLQLLPQDQPLPQSHETRLSAPVSHDSLAPLPFSDQVYESGEPFPCLLTRLDQQTSGIVLAARTKKSSLLFRQAEQAGRVAKNYLALIRGELGAPLTLTQQLDMRNRATTAVLPEEEADATRHTQAIPVRLLCPEEKKRLAAALPDATVLPQAVTLVEVTIHRGARHQIRAHLAHAGFPVLGETRYADALCAAPHPLFLHHARVRLNLDDSETVTITAQAPWSFLD